MLQEYQLCAEFDKVSVVGVTHITFIPAFVLYLRKGYIYFSLITGEQKKFNVQFFKRNY
ncbi:hypothetical protein CCAND38_310035 [Capnocytophaga canis]|uniref:Uncharacterized protein n=1 Tax=Capnocytophaga canis TaxID=1848903 RepID=A0A0B7I2B0_9FLAO|nr:hypothetical protein CCAND38_310035 [Capnocytophaga canis]